MAAKTVDSRAVSMACYWAVRRAVRLVASMVALLVLHGAVDWADV